MVMKNMLSGIAFTQAHTKLLSLTFLFGAQGSPPEKSYTNEPEIKLLTKERVGLLRFGSEW